VGEIPTFLLKTMPAIQRSEFALALNQVATERGIDLEVVLDTVKNAILAAYKKDHPGTEEEEYSVTLDENTGEARVFLKDKDITPPGFGRIAAQTAKQVILQKIREKEKEAILSDYMLKVGTIINGMVLRFAGPNIIIDIGKTEGIMPLEDQIPNEKYHLNQRLAVYLAEIRPGLKGDEIIVSRANNGLLEGLFKREVPEVSQGSVEIKQIVREPGVRAKVAVFSTQPGIDPVGSCVGQKGVRVQAIIQEFGGIEKIDIIQWQENPKNFITASLSPAKELKVEIDEAEKMAKVTVPEEELSLAIGKDGQNVRLASKLTGYRIEIEGAPAKEVKEVKEAIEPEVETEAPKEAVEPEVKAEPAKEVPEDSASTQPVSGDAQPVEETPVVEPVEEAAATEEVQPEAKKEETEPAKEAKK
jgi:N utilization substance protein A